MEVSLFASSIRPSLFSSFIESLKSSTVSYEVIFAGPSDIPPTQTHLPTKYIKTNNIKPAQCYEIARRNCSGDVVMWVADDCEFHNDVIGKSYKYWKSQNNEKLVLSIQTKESGYGYSKTNLFDMNVHRFFGGRENTPLMAPIGLMSRKYLDQLGGLDRRYVCGQYENDIVMRVLADGGEVKIFGDSNCFVEIDHLGKSYQCGESKTEVDFLKRPFALGYVKDREILEKSWVKNGRVSFERNDQFEPFVEENILVSSQSNKGIWE